MYAALRSVIQRGASVDSIIALRFDTRRRALPDKEHTDVRAAVPVLVERTRP
jgi:hypothetical protein